MFLKVMNSYRNVVAICDEDLVGKRFENGEFQLDVKENFFKDKQVSEEELLKIMERMLIEDSTFNIVGEKSIQIALKAGIINKDSIGKIQNIPFALVLM